MEYRLILSHVLMYKEYLECLSYQEILLHKKIDLFGPFLKLELFHLFLDNAKVFIPIEQNSKDISQ